MTCRETIAAVVLASVSLAPAAEPAPAAESALRPFVVPLLDPPPAPLDLRAVFDGPRGDQLPAVRVKDGRFVAGGERVRFWGVNLCFAGCFPAHDVADRLAAKLAAYGINCVRFHHMDMQAFPRGIWNRQLTSFDAEAMDRLDYFLAALKREGVYANINLHVSRDFSRTGSSYPKDSTPSFGKQVCIIDPALVELQKQYARDLLGHVNPYTKLRYADDPVVALVEITNENSIFLSRSKRPEYQLSPRFDKRLVELWNEFLVDKYADVAAMKAAWADDDQWSAPEGASLARMNIGRLAPDEFRPGRRTEDYIEFLTRVDMRFFTEMRDFLRRELGVQCPITGTEGFTLPSDYVQSHLDYVDAHGYWQHPKFPGRGWDRRDWTIPNTAMVDEPTDKSTLLLLTFQRMLNPDGSGRPMPLTVSEYNHCAPNDYQAEGIPMVAAFAAAQDWDGIFLFAYKHNDAWDQDHVTSYFDIHSNPVKVVQLAAGALLFRRGDVKALDRRVTTHIPPKRMYELSAAHLPWTDKIVQETELDAPPAKRFFGRYAIASYPAPAGAESPTTVTPTAAGAPWTQGSDGVHMVSSSSSIEWAAAGPGTGQFYAGGDRSVVLVGFKSKGPAIAGDRFDISLETPEFAAVTVSSLDDRPLDRARRILITACSRTENSAQVWNDDRTSVGNGWGKAPTLIEPVVARIRLPHAAESATLIALGGNGKPFLPTWTLKSTDGSLDVSLGDGPATLWYLLECE